ncbi:MAG: hypothetical protein NT154_15130 [Verrucomicrobia bacterium]|nr:hypothetical protein [Verrucomicrobiota bacterium]
MADKDNKGDEAQEPVSVDTLIARIKEIEIKKQATIEGYDKQKSELVAQLKAAMKDVAGLLGEGEKAAPGTSKRILLPKKMRIPEALKQCLPKKNAKGSTAAELKPGVDKLCGCDVPKANIAAALSKMVADGTAARPEEGKYRLA